MHVIKKLLSVGFVSISIPASASDAITIYSSAQPGSMTPEQYRPDTGVPVPGYAMVRHERNMNLKNGRTLIRFSDVAAQIDPTTVTFESLTDPVHTRVVEQSYQFDLVSTDRLLQKYIDREISVDQERNNSTQTFTGILSSTKGGIVLRNRDGSVQILNGYAGVKLPEIPGGLISKPTLLWNISAQKEGEHKTRVAYQTGGITWWSDYNLTYTEGKEGACEADLGAWVSILNQSGATYNDAKLKLIAGDVQRASLPTPERRLPMQAMAKSLDAAESFEEKSFFEYHLYTLGFLTTIADNSTKQLELFPVVKNIKCQKSLVYLGQGADFRTYGGLHVDRGYGAGSNNKVDVYINFKNSKPNNMGMPLPAGRMRVSKLDTADNSLELIGEDIINHTAKDESILIKLGSAFDVVGERKQTNFRVDQAAKWMEEDIEIKLRNHKDEAVVVQVRENLYRWTNWNVIRKSQDFEKQDAKTIQFPVRIAKAGEATVKYTVRYTW